MALAMNDIHYKGAKYAAATAAALATSAVRIMGYAAYSTDAGDVVDFYDATATSGEPAFTVVAPGAASNGHGSGVAYFGPNGVRFANGLYVVAGGNSVCAVFYLDD